MSKSFFIDKPKSKIISFPSYKFDLIEGYVNRTLHLGTHEVTLTIPLGTKSVKKKQDDYFSVIFNSLLLLVEL